jgi:hypothetical protein
MLKMREYVVKRRAEAQSEASNAREMSMTQKCREKRNQKLLKRNLF